ncbi:MAG TPA: hypothetical protein PL009_12345 [Flavipsychrobacter sp.]|nr:hypothetical protein [Flavipsychrobacter sp.]
MQDETKRSPEEFKVDSNWDSSSKQLREKYSTLTAEDVKFETGKENDLLGRIEKRLGKKREEVISLINGVQAKK